MYRQSKKCVKQQYLLHMSSQYELGPLAAEIGWRVWGTPANFNGFRVLVSLLQRRRSTEVSQTLYHVWPCPALYVHFRGLLPPNGILRGTLRPRLAFSGFGSCTAMALEQWSSAKLCGVQQRAPSIFSRAAITLSIGPHSSPS